MRQVLLAVLALMSLSGAAKAAPAIEDYGRFPAISDVSLSPSGARLALVANAADGRRLFVKSVASGEFLLSLPLEGVRFAGVQWAGDDHLILYTTITMDWAQGFGSRYLSQVNRASVVNLATHKGFDLFGKGGDVVNAVFGGVQAAQVGGTWYAYAAGRPGGERPDSIGDPILYKVNLDTGERTVFARGNDLTDGWFVGPSGQIVARMESNSLGDWKVLAGQDGLAITSGHSKYSGAGIRGFGRTQGTILIEEPVTDTAFTDRIEEWPLTPGGKPVVQTLSNDPLWLHHDRVTGVLIGQQIEGDSPSFSFFDPATAARFNGARNAFSGVNVRLVSAGEGFGRMVVYTDGGDDSGTYWPVDITTGKANVLGEEYPTVNSADVGSTKMIEYKAADGLTIHALLTLPAGRDAKNLPLVVMPHGPIGRDRLGFDWWAQAFASRGYAVLQPNFRGSDGYGEDFITAGFGQWGHKMQTDLSDGIAYLGAQGIADPKRACIVGANYGGYAALAGVTMQHGVYRCAVAYAPVADLAEMTNYSSDRYGESVELADWDRYIGANSRSALSPAAHAGEADAPVLIFQGKFDEIVPMSQSIEMDSHLRGAGKTSTLVLFDNETHHMVQESTRLAVVKQSVDFVEKYNPSDPPPK
jgi:dipeptidyl aminopeptidase/acylaminoacyl peptidase